MDKPTIRITEKYLENIERLRALIRQRMSIMGFTPSEKNRFEGYCFCAESADVIISAGEVYFNIIVVKENGQKAA